MSRLRFLPVALAGLVAASITQARETETVEIAGGALAFDVPGDWQAVAPKSRILEKEFAIVCPAGVKATSGRLTIMAAGGSVQANLARWVGQFRGTEGGAVRDGSTTEELEVGGMPATLFDMSGTYLESAGGPFGPKTPRPDYQMLGAIVETGGSGNYFFKLVGPKETVAPAAEDFKAMIQSLKKK